MEKLYKVQTGAYRSRAHAVAASIVVENAIKKYLQKKKIIEKVSVAVISSGGWHKVQVGAFSSKKNAERRLAIVTAAGLKEARIMETKTQDQDYPQSEWGRVLAVLNGFMAAKNPHRAVIDCLKKHGYTLKESTAWCTETITAAFWEAGCLDLIGGKNFQQSKKLKDAAQAMGTWHSGKDGIKAGDIVIFGTTPNHSEIAVDDTYDISGNYNGTVAKRKRDRGSTINGYIRPRYKTSTPESSEAKTEAGTPASSITKLNSVRFWLMKFWASNPDHIYGDASMFIEYRDDGKIERTALVDTGMNHSDTDKLLDKAGITYLSYIIVSHDHGDHMGGVSRFLDKYKIGEIILPDQSGVRKYQKKYAERIDSIARKARKKGVKVTYMKPGRDYPMGDALKFRCLWQADATKLTSHDDHHFINDMSPQCQMVVYPGTAHEWVFDLAGDLSRKAGGLQQMLKAVGDCIEADFGKLRWHGDVYGCSAEMFKAVGAKVWFSNYHHKSSWGGRHKTYDAAKSAGAEVFTNYDDGEIYVDMVAVNGVSTAEVYCSGNKNKTKTYTKGTPKAAWTKYMVRLTTKVSPSELDKETLVAVEFDDYTADEIKKLKATGATVLAYLSVGTAEKDRPAAWEKLKDYAMKQLEDWPEEYYLDLRQTGARKYVIQRAIELQNKGADGFWADNIDLYEEYPSTEMYNAITAVLDAIHFGITNINGGMAYLDKAMDKDGSKYQGIGNVDIVTQEEVFSRITSYKGDGEFSVQTEKQSSEYQNHLKRAARHKMIPALLEYTKDSRIKDKIRAFCAETGALACVSDKVNL